MAEHIRRCPLCGSELFMSERATYCSNPRCNYLSDVAPIHKVYKGNDLLIGLLPLAFMLIVLGLILIFISLIFAAIVTFFFIPFILPIPFLRRLLKRKRSTLRHKREV
ncbi:MAG: hypothetical protein ACUVTD_00375 [Nitrososphaerales archaeon]